MQNPLPDTNHSVREEKHSTGVWILLLISVVSSFYLMFRSKPDKSSLSLWTFEKNHVQNYQETLSKWKEGSDISVDVEALDYEALDQKLMSAFHAGLPVADLVEVELRLAHKTWLGPVDSIGFYDISDKLKEEGWDQLIAEEAFGPWSLGNHVFGLPRDLHPVMLAYRADIIEDEYGIDVSRLDTWDKFMRAMRPLVQDLNGDGIKDRYILNMPENVGEVIRTMLRQGGLEFNDQDVPTLNNSKNVDIFVTLADWATGHDKVTTDVRPFQGTFFRLFADGYFLAAITPDWRSATFEREIPSLAGKIKLMPLPAWEEGGRRTSVWGGIMMGIPKTTKHFDEAWTVAKELYLSQHAAEVLFRAHNIISSNRSVWFDDYYDEPSPYYSNQPLGRLYLDLVHDIPRRSASPYQQQFEFEVMTAFVRLRRLVEQKGLEIPSQIRPYAQQMLDDAQKNIIQTMKRNHFQKVDWEEFEK